MPKGTRICKVCGKEYPYCTTITKNVFRWQDVACCQEHAMEYFKLVEDARNEKTLNKNIEEEVALFESVEDDTDNSDDDYEDEESEPDEDYE